VEGKESRQILHNIENLIALCRYCYLDFCFLLFFRLLIVANKQQLSTPEQKMI
jgi:hypothetical protein